MRRKMVTALLILVCILLQSTVCQMISIASIKPNLLIILIVSFGLMRGRRSGMMIGFFCGLLTDLFFESVLGFNAIIYMWVGYFSGYFYRLCGDAWLEYRRRVDVDWHRQRRNRLPGSLAFAGQAYKADDPEAGCFDNAGVFL